MNDTCVFQLSWKRNKNN